MRRHLRLAAVAAGLCLLWLHAPTAAQDGKPILIGVDSPIQLEVGRDTVDAVQMAIDEINAKGGVLGRKLAKVVADETMDPQQGVSAINKLTADHHVDVLIGGYSSGVTLAQVPHIAEAKTIYLGIGSASPSITAYVKRDYKRYKYIFRVNPMNSARQAEQLGEFVTGKLKGDMGYKKIAIIGENAKWVQDLAPVLKAAAVKGGVEVPMMELFDPEMSDFSPLFAKVKSTGVQYMLIILSHANSDVFVKQWYDAKLAIPIGGIDVKGQDPDFFTRIGGKAISETMTLPLVPVPITPKTIPFWEGFNKQFKRAPVYTAPGGYDALYIYAEAVTRAKSTDPEKVIPELEKTSYLGTQGTYAFDDTHDVKPGKGFLNLLFVQWQDGGKRAIVWPKDVANGKMILPPWMEKK
jgi:branched-chain amino acid transport system substrate-binding protein